MFVIDASNYQAHVFAGLAALQLGKQQEARQHYQSAIAIAPHEQLAWKVTFQHIEYSTLRAGYREWLTCITKVLSKKTYLML